MIELFQNIFIENNKLITIHKKEKRLWDPFHSKAAAALKKNLKNWPFKEDSKVLYLGVAEGTTASHLSDILTKGVIIGVDLSAEPFKKLLKLCEKRSNIIPVLSNANQIENYKEIIDEVGKVDIVYQDLAQKIQADILIKNSKHFLKENGTAIYMIKALSIDVTQKPSKTFKQEIEKLEKAGFEIIEKKSLEPFQKGHAVLIAKYKK